MKAKTFPIELSENQIKSLIADIKSDVVRHLITDPNAQFDYYTSSQVAGLIGVNARTLSGLPIPKYPLSGGKIILYRLSEVDEYLQSVREK